ncbi:Beta-galactosidase C-terminal domain [Paenibacillus whitsoniae]|uniref:Beta-galactosidase trimerisation domain-containing protein n=1 Tax=Paenibacillus whitsoniae TaxID=2496558 RepID=A0A430JDT2_9BACL|nr:hypothetical protein EJQ19_12580 [Paenibacillus whitsoniae]
MDSPQTKVVARYTTDYYKDSPAIVRHKVGRGEVIYFGTFFTKENTDQLLNNIPLIDPLEFWVHAPAEVEVVTRNHPSGEIAIFLNYTSHSQFVEFKESVRNCLTTEIVAGKIEIEPYGVRRVQRV